MGYKSRCIAARMELTAFEEYRITLNYVRQVEQVSFDYLLKLAVI